MRRSGKHVSPGDWQMHMTVTYTYRVGGVGGVTKSRTAHIVWDGIVSSRSLEEIVFH